MNTDAPIFLFFRESRALMFSIGARIGVVRGYGGENSWDVSHTRDFIRGRSKSCFTSCQAAWDHVAPRFRASRKLNKSVTGTRDLFIVSTLFFRSRVGSLMFEEGKD